MANTEPRRQTQDLLLTCAETTNRTAQEGSVRSFFPSAQTASTFTAPNMATAYVGYYVIPEDGGTVAQVRQIKSVTGTTATVDASWTFDTTATAIRAWLPADIPVVATSADSSTPFDVIATGHASVSNEPDDYWNEKGYNLISMSGNNAGSAKAFTDFTSSTGTFAAGANAAVSVGDLFALRKMLRPAAEPEATVSQKFLERRAIGTGSYDAENPITITTDGSVKFELEQRPIGTAGSAAQQVGPPTEIADLLEDHFTQRRDTGGTVTLISATTVTATSLSMSVGGFGLLNTGEAFQAYAISGTTATHSTGNSIVTNGSVTTSSTLYASSSFIRKASDYRSRTFDLYRGGKLRQLFHGCMPKLTLTISREQTIKFGFDYMAGEAFEYNLDRPVTTLATNPITIPDLGVPTDGKGARCLIDGTRLHVVSMTIDFGLAPVMRASLSGVNQYDGCMMTMNPVSGNISLYADADDISGFRDVCDRIRRNRIMQFFYQKGTSPGGTFCVGIPAMGFTGGTFAYQDGQGIYNVPFSVVDPALAMFGGSQIYPTSTYPGLPGLAFGWV